MTLKSKSYYLLIFFLMNISIMARGQVNVLPQVISSSPELKHLFVDSLYIINSVEANRAGYVFIKANREMLKKLITTKIEDSAKSYVYGMQRQWLTKGIFEFDKVYTLGNCIILP